MGVPFSSSLGLTPQWPTILALALFERVALHWRTAFVFVAGHVVAVGLVSAVLWTVRDVEQPWLHVLRVGLIPHQPERKIVGRIDVRQRFGVKIAMYLHDGLVCDLVCDRFLTAAPLALRRQLTSL